MFLCFVPTINLNSFDNLNKLNRKNASEKSKDHFINRDINFSECSITCRYNSIQ